MLLECHAAIRALLAIALVVSCRPYGHYLLLSDRENTKVAAHIHNGEKACSTAEDASGQFREAEGRPAADRRHRRPPAESHRRARSFSKPSPIPSAAPTPCGSLLGNCTGDALTINGSLAAQRGRELYYATVWPGYFQSVEIKESHQDETNKAEIFNFSLTAQFGLTQTASGDVESRLALQLLALGAPLARCSTSPVTGKPGTFGSDGDFVPRISVVSPRLPCAAGHFRGEGLPTSPVATIRSTLDDNHTKDSELNRQVSELQVYERRNAEFKVEMAARKSIGNIENDRPGR